MAFKMQLQQLWIRKVGWDDPFNEVETETFRENAKNLENAVLMRTPRNFAFEHGSKRGKIELNMFCDAGLKGYGCVAYARKIFSDQSIEVSFIIAKGRVAPLKGEWSIHRLDLLETLLPTKIANAIRRAARTEFSAVHFWTDNACVLAWVRDDPSRWKQFVANRVREILKNAEASQFHYIRTKDNPADLVSRADSLDTPEKREFRLFGPKWLASADGPEKNISSWEKAVGIVAYIRRWLSYKRKRACRQDRSEKRMAVSAKEYFDVEISILKCIQRRTFPSEIASELKSIEKSSQIFQFNPRIDDQGLVRCTSRLVNSAEVD